MGGPVVPSLAAQLRRICSGPRLRANDSSVCLGWKGSRRCCAVAWLASIFLRPRLEVCKSLGSSASGTRARVYRELLAALLTQCGQLTCSLRCEPVPDLQAGSCRTEPRGDPWWPRAPAGAVWSGSAGAVRRQNLPPRHCFSVVDGSRRPGVALGITGGHSARAAVRGGVGCVRRRATR